MPATLTASGLNHMSVCLSVSLYCPPLLAGTLRPVVCSPRSALATSVEPAPERRAGGGLKEFLKDKTGVTGAGTLAFGLGALAVSKELIIIHAEVCTHTHTHTHTHTLLCCNWSHKLCNPQTLVAASMGVVIYYLVKRVGGDVGQYLDQYGQDILDTFSSSRKAAISKLEASIQQEEALEGMLECRKEAFDVLKVRWSCGCVHVCMCVILALFRQLPLVWDSSQLAWTAPSSLSPSLPHPSPPPPLPTN